MTITLDGSLGGEPNGRRDLALRLADAALRSVDAEAATARALREFDLPRRVFLLAFGKAAVPMARAALRAVPDAWGFVIAPEEVELPGLISFVGGHPLPGLRAEDHGRAVLAAAQALGPDDVALCLVSGGGSAMLEVPADGHRMDEIRATTAKALKAGVGIDTLNRVRRELSAVKGSKLAEALSPARLVNIVLSDVPGLPPSVVASGPTWSPQAEWVVAADNETAQDAIVDAAASLGVRLVRIEAIVNGEAREAGARLVQVAAQLLRDDPTLDGIVTGGETTVLVKGDGRGGRNGELVCGAASDLGEHLILSLASDGADGTSDSAGALLDSEGVRLATALGGPLEVALSENDTARWLRSAGLLLRTGATGTNVADVQLVLR